MSTRSWRRAFSTGVRRPRAFMDGESAIAWTTTGNLTNIRSNAPFDFGVADAARERAPRRATGGGNFYLFEGSSDEQLQAAVDFVNGPRRRSRRPAGRSINRLCCAPRPDTWETDAMRALCRGGPRRPRRA